MRRTLLALFSTLAVSLSIGCSNEDPDPAAGAGGSSSGGAGAAGSSSGGAAGATGGGGATAGACVDPRSEASLIPLEDRAGSGVFEGLAVDGGELFFSDLEGIYAQPLAGGARVTVTTIAANVFRVSGTVVRFNQGFGGVREAPRAGGAVTNLVDFPAGHAVVALADTAAISSDKTIGSLTADGALWSASYTGGAPTMLTTFQSALPPAHFATTTDRVFFGVTATSPGPMTLVSAPLAGGPTTTVALPAGLTFKRTLGVVNGALYVAAEDDFFANTVIKVSAAGDVAAQYSVGNRTATHAVAVPGGVAIGGIDFLDLWKDGEPKGTRVRCFLVGAGVSSPYPTLHSYAASGTDVFLSIRTPEPNKNAIQKITLP